MPPKTSSNAPTTVQNPKVVPRQVIKNESDFKKLENSYLKNNGTNQKLEKYK